MTIQLTHKTVVTETRPVPAARGSLRATWRRVREAIAEMNYASRRVVELQAPWFADKD